MFIGTYLGQDRHCIYGWLRNSGAPQANTDYNYCLSRVRVRLAPRRALQSITWLDTDTAAFYKSHMNPTPAHLASIRAMVLLLQGPSAPWQWCIQCNWPAQINIIILEQHILSFVGSVHIFTVISLKFTYTMYYSLLRLLPDWFVCKFCLSPTKYMQSIRMSKVNHLFHLLIPYILLDWAAKRITTTQTRGLSLYLKKIFFYLWHFSNLTHLCCVDPLTDLHNTNQRYSIMSIRQIPFLSIIFNAPHVCV